MSYLELGSRRLETGRGPRHPQHVLQLTTTPRPSISEFFAAPRPAPSLASAPWTPTVARIDDFGVKDTPQVARPGGGEGAVTYSSADSGSEAWWEEATSVAIAPDGVTFWATGEWLSSNESSCCNWQTQVFACQEGQTGGFCP